MKKNCGIDIRIHETNDGIDTYGGSKKLKLFYALWITDVIASADSYVNFLSFICVRIPPSFRDVFKLSGPFLKFFFY